MGQRVPGCRGRLDRGSAFEVLGDALLWPVFGWSALTRVALAFGREQDAKEGVDKTFALLFGLVLRTGCPKVSRH